MLCSTSPEQRPTRPDPSASSIRRRRALVLKGPHVRPHSLHDPQVDQAQPPPAAEVGLQ